MKPLRPLLLACLAAGAFLPASASAQSSGDILSLRFEEGQAIVDFTDRPGEYYILEESEDYEHWRPADASLGLLPLGSEVDPDAPRRFYRVRPYSQFAPLDTDGDGIDDIYELNHPGLNPLDPTDGSKLAPGGGGLTNFQYYQQLFGITSYKILQLEGREVSLFNFGSPSATFEANSREQSIFNFGSPSATVEANSLELSVYNGQHVPYSDLIQIEGREFSIFNFGEAAPGPGGQPAAAEAISHEVSIYNGQHVPYSDLLQIEGREVSVFNFGEPSAPVEAISREVSVLNFEEP